MARHRPDCVVICATSGVQGCQVPSRHRSQLSSFATEGLRIRTLDGAILPGPRPARRKPVCRQRAVPAAAKRCSLGGSERSALFPIDRVSAVYELKYVSNSGANPSEAREICLEHKP